MEIVVGLVIVVYKLIAEAVTVHKADKYANQVVKRYNKE